MKKWRCKKTKPCWCLSIDACDQRRRLHRLPSQATPECSPPALCATARVQTHGRRPCRPLSTALATLQLPRAASPCAGSSSVYASSHARTHAVRLPTAASYARQHSQQTRSNAGTRPSIIVFFQKLPPAQHAFSFWLSPRAQGRL